MFASCSFFFALLYTFVPTFIARHLTKYARIRFPTILWLVVFPAQAAVTPRFICTFSDGRSHFSVTDLSAGSTNSIFYCSPVLVDIAAPESPPHIDSRFYSPMFKNTTSVKHSPSQKQRVSKHVDAIPPELSAQIDVASARHRLDPKLVGALIYVESRYKSDAVSPKGAIGLMQVMPATAKRYGVNTASQLLDPAVNIDVGTRYLRDLHAIYGHRIDLVLAAYNAGEGAVARYGQRVPPYPETLAYVAKIGSLLNGRDTSR